MSYIRATSNKEQLYVYETSNGVEFMVSGKLVSTISKKCFSKLLERYITSTSDDDIHTNEWSLIYEDCYIKLQFYKMENGKPVQYSNIKLYTSTFDVIALRYKYEILTNSMSFIERLKFLFNPKKYTI